MSYLNVFIIHSDVGDALTGERKLRKGVNFFNEQRMLSAIARELTKRSDFDCCILLETKQACGNTAWPRKFNIPTRGHKSRS